MIQFRVERDWARRDGYNFWMISYRGERAYIVKPFQLELVEVNPTSILPEPSLQVSGDEGREIVEAARKAFAGLEWISKDEWDTHAKVEKAMQAHIDSLRLVVERTVKP